MTRRLLPRLGASLLLLAQLAWLPATLACEEAQPSHRSHCSAEQETGVPAVAAAADQAPACGGTGMCAAASAAVGALPFDAALVTGDVRDAAPAAPARPDSFDPSPSSPPPQA